MSAMTLISIVLIAGLAAMVLFPRMQDRKRVRSAGDVGALMARGEFRQALEMLPTEEGTPELRVARGWCLLLTGRTDEGLTLLRREDGDLPREPKLRIDLWMNQARGLALTNGDPAKATALATRVKRAIAQLPTAWVANLEAALDEIDGWMHLHREQAVHALQAFDRSVAHPTGRVWIDAARYYGKACALMELGRYEEAKTALRAAADLGPDIPNVSKAHELLAEMQKQGR